MALHEFIDLSALILLIVANSAPVLLARVLGSRLATAIDGGRCLRDGRPILGPHKTWRGLAAGIIATGLAGIGLSSGFLSGALFGALALAGDLASSFLKRRLAFRSGHSVPLLDQLPESLLPLLVLNPVLGLTLLEIAGTCIAFGLLDSVTAPFRASEEPRDKTLVP